MRARTCSYKEWKAPRFCSCTSGLPTAQTATSLAHTGVRFLRLSSNCDIGVLFLSVVFLLDCGARAELPEQHCPLGLVDLEKASGQLK